MSIYTIAVGVSPPVPPPDNGAGDLVREGWDQAQAYAANAFDNASNFLDQIATISGEIGDIPDVDVNLDPITTTISPYVSPVLPLEPGGMSVNLPAAPAEPSLGAVAALDVGAAPEFTAQPADVDLSIAPPDALTTAVPAAPTLPEVAIPAAPALTLPDVPTLIGLSLPAAPALNLPSFAATLAAAPTAPANTFAFTESSYTSTLLTNLRARLLEWVDGASTGLAAAVEQAIWDRGRAREAVASLRKAGEALRQFASRGWTKPPGAAAVEALEAVQTAQSSDLALSREVMIKQAELEQSNRRFAFEQAWAVESGLVQYASQIAQRAFDTAKYAQQVAIEIFQAEVQRYAADVQAYVAQAEVFKTLITAELAKLEVYKAELEGQRLIGQLNLQSVEIYKARVDAAVSVVAMYRAQVEAANAAAQVNKTRIEAFAAEVGAYDSLVKAKTAEYQGYATRVQAEVAKIEVFKAQADAYGSQVNGFRALVDARVAEKNAEIKIEQEVPLDLFKARTEVFRAQAAVEGERVQALGRIYETRATVFGAEVRGEEARVGAEATQLKAEADVAVAEGNVRIEAAKANIQKLISQVTLLSEAVRAGAQVSAQLAAAALSAVNLSGGISASTSESSANSSSNAASNVASSQIGDMTYHNLSTE